LRSRAYDVPRNESLLAFLIGEDRHPGGV